MQKLTVEVDLDLIHGQPEAAAIIETANSISKPAPPSAEKGAE